jgi:predicted nucleic acid-binding protein
MKIKVYLDNCSYNRPFDDQRQIRIFLETQAKLHIQHLITDNELVLACSYMSIYENSNNPHEERRFSIADFFSHASLFVDYDKAENVEMKAAEIMEQNINNKDAIHIACAIEAECDYFITTDDDLIKKYTGNDIIICSPVELINILEEQNE